MLIAIVRVLEAAFKHLPLGLHVSQRCTWPLKANQRFSRSRLRLLQGGSLFCGGILFRKKEPIEIYPSHARGGGGYRHGSLAQEEDLFRRTTLSTALVKVS